MNVTDLNGKVVLVTGAASGIGKASAQAFARLGAKVVVADIDGEGGRETVRLIEQEGGLATFIQADVSLSQQVEGLVHATIEIYGRLDCAHNNAGIEGPLAPIADYNEAEFDRVLAINLKGVWLCMKHEIAQMLKQGNGGALVNTCSIAGLVGAPANSGYIASKHGVAGLTRAVALEYARAGIRINAICPGVTDTPMFERTANNNARLVDLAIQQIPLKRPGTPQEIANVVIWLCSDEASYLTGVLLPADGGLLAQ